MKKKIKAKKTIRVKKAQKSRQPKTAPTLKTQCSIKDLKLFKNVLMKLKEDTSDQMQHIYDNTLKKSQKDAAGDISGYSLHMADVATDTYDREFSLGLASNTQDLLYEIEDALKRVDEKIFGLCEQCHKPIAKSRLKALPYTRTCLKCKESSERR